MSKLEDKKKELQVLTDLIDLYGSATMNLEQAKVNALFENLGVAHDELLKKMQLEEVELKIDIFQKVVDLLKPHHEKPK
jgi:hypothetical protein|tara:strand:- start:25398 stop:25634 length:237 start_codon:yes stop_codon:yes gene_type:complete